LNKFKLLATASYKLFYSHLNLSPERKNGMNTLVIKYIIGIIIIFVSATINYKMRRKTKSRKTVIIDMAILYIPPIIAIFLIDHFGKFGAFTNAIILAIVLLVAFSIETYRSNRSRG
jgi:hypothetical protein